MEAYEGHRRRELTCEEAALVLGVSERHFRRMRDMYDAEGAEGIVDRRLGRASARRVPVDDIAWILDEYRTRYRGFTARHFVDKMQAEPRFKWGTTWTKMLLHQHGLLEKAPRRGAHRKKRARRPLEGMMIHQDGSRHDWLSNGETWDLIVTMDDATSTIYSAFLCAEEGTQSSFQGLADVIGVHGLPSSVYTDRGSHYFTTPEAGGKVDKTRSTQVGRALKQLGIEHIPAYSPEARGRSERMFQTLQDRLVNELALAGIKDVAEANAFIRDVYLPDHNRRFSVPAEQPGGAFVAVDEKAWRDILCVHEERRVESDNTLRYKRIVLQIPESPERPHFVRATVRVHEYTDRTLAVFHGPRRLATYTAQGQLMPEGARSLPVSSPPGEVPCFCLTPPRRKPVDKGRLNPEGCRPYPPSP
jgi:hypothetical protein